MCSGQRWHQRGSNSRSSDPDSCTVPLNLTRRQSTRSLSHWLIVCFFMLTFTKFRWSFIQKLYRWYTLKRITDGSNIFLYTRTGWQKLFAPRLCSVPKYHHQRGKATNQYEIIFTFVWVPWTSTKIAKLVRCVQAHVVCASVVVTTRQPSVDQCPVSWL